MSASIQIDTLQILIHSATLGCSGCLMPALSRPYIALACDWRFNSVAHPTLRTMTSQRANDDAPPDPASLSAANPADADRALPLPGWLVKLYFVFPVVLYIPDAIFNYF